MHDRDLLSVGGLTVHSRSNGFRRTEVPDFDIIQFPANSSSFGRFLGPPTGPGNSVQRQRRVFVPAFLLSEGQTFLGGHSRLFLRFNDESGHVWTPSCKGVEKSGHLFCSCLYTARGWTGGRALERAVGWPAGKACLRKGR